MRLLLAIVFVSCSFSAFADTTPAPATPPGNQGYVYGSAPKADDSSTAPASNLSGNPVKDIIDGVNKLDEWIQTHLW
jgi:hypothetical protein